MLFVSKYSSFCASFIYVIVLISCNANQKQPQKKITTQPIYASFKDTIITEGNKTTTYSFSLNKLSKIIDFKSVKPIKVQFKYTFIDNSGQNNRIDIPGPSDYWLQAVLYFDSATFEQFLERDRYTDYPSPNFELESFNFNWLNDSLRKELKASKPSYHGHPNFFFGVSNAKLWYLDKKILLIAGSNP